MVHACAVCECGQRLVSGFFLGCSPPYILAQGLSELTYLAGLARQFALRLSCYCLQVLKLQAGHRPSQHHAHSGDLNSVVMAAWPALSHLLSSPSSFETVSSCHLS